MSDLKDFIIENGVLIGYTGPAGDIVIPDGVNRIKKGAFFPRYLSQKRASCIKIPASVAFIEAGWQTGSFSPIEHVEVSIDNKKYCSENGVLFNKDKTELISVPETLKGDYIIPEGVKTISKDAFYFCKKIVYIYIPKTVCSFEEPCIGCGNLTAIEVSDENEHFCSVDGVLFNKEKTELIKYPLAKKGSCVTIPDGIVEIHGMACQCDEITELTIPESVKIIRKYAFSYNKNLTSVNLPGTINPADMTWEKTNILEDGACSPFSGCAALKKINYYTQDCNEEMKNLLGDDVFWGRPEPEILRAPMVEISRICSKFKKAATLGFVDAIVDGFEAEPEIAEDYKKYIARQKKNMYPLLMQDAGRVKYLVDNKLIPLSDFEKCLNMAGENVEIRTMLIEYKEKTFGYESVEKFEERKIEIALGIKERTVTEWNKIFLYKKSDDGIVITTYKGEDDIVEVPQKIGEDIVVGIGNEGFTSLAIKERNEKSWGNIKQIFIPDSVTRIDPGVLKACSSLTNIEVGANNAKYKSIEGSLYSKKGKTLICYPSGKKQKSFTIPEGVTKIDKAAFWYCESLESVTIPDSITEIKMSTFLGCTSLASVSIPDSVTKICDSAFLGCTSLTNIVLPQKLCKIGWGVFRGCISLASVTIPDGVTKICESTFWDCSGLTKIILPQNLHEIGGSAFMGCTSLASVTIPDSVTKISENAFSGCINLESVAIPDSVTEICRYAFKGCKSLKSIIIPDSVTEIGNGAFSKTSTKSICGRAGSCAEKYAQNNNIPFVVE